MQESPEILVKVYRYAYKLKVDGKSSDEIKSELIIQGIDDRTADVIADATEKNYGEIMDKARRKNLIHGVGWFAAGAALVLLTYFLNLHDHVYPYFIAGCALVFGASRLALVLAKKQRPL